MIEITKIKSAANQIAAAALKAADPATAVSEFLVRKVADVSKADIIVVGAGKASVAMAQATDTSLKSMPYLKGTVISSTGFIASPSRIKILEGDHPYTTQKSVAATKNMMDMLSQTSSAKTSVVALVSGGASALMELPVEGLMIEDIAATSKALMSAGAPIQELNVVRKHLSQVKGGQLLRFTGQSKVISLVLSDVVGSPLDIIASGPTVPDPSTFGDAIAILETRKLFQEGTPLIPQKVKQYLIDGAKGLNPETPKPGDPIFDHVETVIIGSNAKAAEAAAKKARELNWQSEVFDTAIEGEAREVGVHLAKKISELRATNPSQPICLVGGGETTVTVRGKGRGGRNQELALAAAIALDGLENVALMTLGTDGIDGPTDAAGAIVDGTTVKRAQQLGLNPQQFLDDNDAYHFFKQLGDLVVTGPTGTNVNDLVFLLIW